MKNMVKVLQSLTILAFVIFISLLPAWAQAKTSIVYPGVLLDASPPEFVPMASNLLGGPKNIYGVEFSSQTTAVYGVFANAVTYNSQDLALLIGVTPETLARADFIAFDNNGVNSGGGGFENSIWIFRDGTHILTHVHNFYDGPNGPVLANNERLNVGDRYNSLFGTSLFNTYADFGVILFDLSNYGINISSPDFSVELKGGGTNCGIECPDIPLLGVLKSVLDVSIDIKPQSCPNPLNVESKGILPVAIIGTKDLNVADLDPASVKLAGVAPIRSSNEDVGAPIERRNACECTEDGPDGITDLSLKFDLQEIVAAIGQVADGEQLTLTLTGKLQDGTLIEGEDCITVLSKEKGERK